MYTDNVFWKIRKVVEILLKRIIESTWKNKTIFLKFFHKFNYTFKLYLPEFKSHKIKSKISTKMKKHIQ